MTSTIGKAYVQILPSAKGLTAQMEGLVEPAGKQAGSTLGQGLLGGVKSVLAAGAIVKIVKDAIGEGAALEQSLGGIETLFKESSDKVKAYARQAFSTAGLSANEYMENVTSFSASLLQSMGGDTDKAADIANTAMIDMADNANKMGTDMESIQNAYQGFAKQNYTMLDNLKLGYGGTQSEMQRLLSDAQKLTGVKYDISSLADVYQAVHVIQDELGITGTTALEAASTVSGSFSSMLAAAKDLMGNMALGEHVKTAGANLSQSVSTFLFENLLPMIGRIVQSLPSAVMGFIEGAAPLIAQAGGRLIEAIKHGITTGIPNLLSKGAELVPQLLSTFMTKAGEFRSVAGKWIMEAVNGLSGAAPKIFASATALVSNVIKTLAERGPEFIKGGFELIGSMAMGLLKAMPKVLRGLGEIIKGILGAVSESLPKLLEKGAALIVELGKGFLNSIPEILKNADEILAALFDGLNSGLEGIKNIGKALIDGLWEGIKGAGEWLKNKVSGFMQNLWGDVKSFFGIQSPSRKFKWAGQMIDEGLAEGITGNLKPVEKAMGNLFAVTEKEGQANLVMRATALTSVTNDEDTYQASTGQGDSTISLLRALLEKNSDIYLDGDTLVGRTLQRVDRALASRQAGEMEATGGYAW